MPEPRKIHLADLTHQGLVLSSNVFPLSIGLVGAWLLDQRPGQATVELFKYPGDFSRALEAAPPAMVGFANYSWNFHLAWQYTRAIKRRWPETVVVFGGPNYGLELEEIAAFWAEYDLIDFVVAREGEEAFVRLFDALEAHGFDGAALRATGTKLPNVHYRGGDGAMVLGENLPRLALEDLPSPYLTGLMDKFFDEQLAPMIHTTRGCPFKCTFCTEGAAYYNVVGQREAGAAKGGLTEELQYIAARVKGPNDLYISDANFGMFKQDIGKAQLIADCQKQYGWPRTIHVSTGKNQKERVVEVAKLLDGALSMAASLQSTNAAVLANVERSNIALGKLNDVGLLGNKVDTGTYSELILGLPGDTVEAHRQSLRDVVEADFDNIRMYQLIMLPQTKLNTPTTRRLHAMKSKHRIMPRSFGRYALAGEDFVAVESEEILTEHATMPFADYVACREMDVTIEILHNGRVYAELQGLCRALDLSWFDFIMRFYDRRRAQGPEIARLYDEFSHGMSARLWDTRAGLEASVTGSIDAMLRDERGTNEMSTAKATAFFMLFDRINAALFGLMKDWLLELGRLDTLTEAHVDALERFSALRKGRLTEPEAEHVEPFPFDLAAQQDARFTLPPDAAHLPAPKNFRIAHTAKQRAQLATWLREFGATQDGMGKMLMRYPHVHRIFRRAEAA